MTDRELLDLIAAQVGVLTTQEDSLVAQTGTLTKDMAEVKTDLDFVKGTVAKDEGYAD